MWKWGLGTWALSLAPTGAGMEAGGRQAPSGRVACPTNAKCSTHVISSPSTAALGDGVIGLAHFFEEDPRLELKWLSREFVGLERGLWAPTAVGWNLWGWPCLVDLEAHALKLPALSLGASG